MLDHVAETNKNPTDDEHWEVLRGCLKNDPNNHDTMPENNRFASPKFRKQGSCQEESCNLANTSTIADETEPDACGFVEESLPFGNDLQTIQHGPVVAICDIGSNGTQKKEVKRPQSWVVPPELLPLGDHVPEHDAMEAIDSGIARTHLVDVQQVIHLEADCLPSCYEKMSTQNQAGTKLVKKAKLSHVKPRSGS